MRDFALEVHFSKWEFAARHHMTASDTQSLSLRDLLALGTAAEREAFEQTWLGYTETFGAPALRELIAGAYERMGADQILCFAGAQEGIYATMRALLTRDDHLIVLTPNYQSAETIPLDLCAVSGVALDENDNWQLDIGRVEAALRPNTKMISINFPNNPTGAVLERARFDALVELCRKRGIWLFSDEVYRLLERDPARRLPQAVDVYERAISLNVMSKAYGLPGLRIGWIACPDRDVLVRVERTKHFLSICNSAPSEKLAAIALAHRDKILDRNRALIASNITVLDDFFAEFADLFDWRASDGGCVAYPRYKGGEGVERFCQDLVEQAGVLLLPASIYRSELTPTPIDRFRIGFGRAGIEEGVAAMRAYLRRNR